MIKICYITTVPITIRAFILKSAEYLHEHTDWEISVICDEDREFAELLPEYIRYFPIPMKRGISLAGIGAMRRMKEIFLRERFDLIQYSTPNASLYASMAGKSAGIPVRLYCQWGIAYVGFHGFKRKIFHLEERYVCGNSTWIEPDSRSNLHFSVQEGLYSEKKASVIWNGSACGLNTEKFDISRKEIYRREIREQYGISEEAFVFCFVGRITRDKGINELLGAFRHLVTEKKSYLFLVGPKEVDETVNQELYRWSEEENCVLYTGFSERVEAYLAASDCYVLPSYREGFGMGVVEAEAMGLPVIVTDIPGPIDGMRDGETGIVIKKGDEEALYQTMYGFRTGEYPSGEMGSAAVTYAITHFEQKQYMKYMLQDRKRLLQQREIRDAV